MRYRLRAVVCVAVMAAVPGIGAASGLAAPARAVVPAARWHVIPVPSSVRRPAVLNDVSASGLTNAWAVGAERETGLDVGVPLILHWNGVRWSKVRVAGLAGPGALVSVSAPSRRDAWALGTDAAGTVLLHWNGARWRSIRFPGERTDRANSVTAAADGLAWLVGSRPNGEILVERWNGRAWHMARTSIVGDLTRVRVSSSGEVWAVGMGASDSIVVHREQGTWKAIDVNTLTFAWDVLGVSARDVWAVGARFNAMAGVDAAIIAHWNGRAWAFLNMPAGVLSQDHSISPNAVGKPQWVGAEAGPHPQTTLYANFQGTMWSAVHGATVLSGVFDAQQVTAHIPGTNATWAVGGSVIDTPSGVAPGKPIIEFNSGIPGI